MADDFLKIDGSLGEGGGQILRTSVALSALTGRPVKLYNIRAKRDNPGLRPQHVGAIKAVAMLCNAQVENLNTGADWLTFSPGTIRHLKAEIDLGTAGSIALVLQAVIPVAVASGCGTELRLIGGTDVRWSPPLDYLREVLIPCLKMMELDVGLDVQRRGYYPKGGGIVAARIRAGTRAKAVQLSGFERQMPRIVSICSKLPQSVAERQSRAASDHLLKHGISCQNITNRIEDAISPGTSIVVYSVNPGGPYLGGDALGERGIPAEEVGRRAAQNLVEEWTSGASVDRHLADMLVPVFSLAPKVSSFRTSCVTNHLLTNLNVSSLITGCKFLIKQLEDGSHLIEVEGVGG